MKSVVHSNQFTFCDTPDDKEVHLIREGLDAYNREQTDGEYDEPGIEINLVLKDSEGNVVGGVNAITMLRVMYLDALWVAEEYRKLGHGRELVMEAERIAKENGCIAVQTYALSFQAPGFFQRLGYKVFGISDGYPDPFREVYLIKRFRSE